MSFREVCIRTLHLGDGLTAFKASCTISQACDHDKSRKASLPRIVVTADPGGR